MRSLLRLCGMALTTVLLAGAAHAQTTLRIGHHHAVGGQVDQAANRFAQIVRERSGGKLDIRVFPAAQLGQEREAYTLVNTGALDLSITSLAQLDQVYPPITVTSLPFVFRDWEHVNKLYNGEFGKVLSEGVTAKTGSVLLGYIHLGFRDMLFRGEPIADASKMKGVKMRSPESTIWIRMFQLLGSSPTPVTWGEVYTAMQTGVAEGLESPALAALDMKFNEVSKSLVRTGHMFGSMGFFGSKDRLSRLPQDQQDLLKAAAQEAGNWASETIARPGEEEAYKKMTSLGMKVVSPTDAEAWAKAMQPLWQEVTSKSPESAKLLQMIRDTK